MPVTEMVNISHYLIEQARERPGARAIVFPVGRDEKGRARYTQLTFEELNEESDLIARGLEAYGIGRGCRTVLMVRPSLEFFSLTFAMFKAGAVPVMIDPGMGRDRLLECIREVEPEAMIGIPKAHVARLMFPRYFRTMRRFVTVGRRWFWGGKTLAEIRAEGMAATTAPSDVSGALRRPAQADDGEMREPPPAEVAYLPAARKPAAYKPAPTRADEMAAILFTTGSTGPAKGVVYEHGMFDAQVKWIQSAYGIQPGEIDLPGFPLFALFSCAMGMTCVIPDMDPTRPARVNPAKIVEAIQSQGCTNSFGSPAIWNRVSRYCVDRAIRLPTLRRVLMAGAPAPGEVIARMRQTLAPAADCHTPYGATEALPVASISGREIEEETDALTRRGAGTCVGRPFEGIDLRIIRISDDPIDEWDGALVLPRGEIGEIAVKGPIVTREYFNQPEATRLAKIKDGADGAAGATRHVWHRMGDVGYLDEKGRLWFCGRKAHRVVAGNGKTYFTIRCEAIFNQHPGVSRSALVGVGSAGHQRPVIIIESREGHAPRGEASHRRFVEELRALGAANELTRDIHDFLFHPAFPVDIRHNAKIFRERLSRWAAQQLRQ